MYPWPSHSFVYFLDFFAADTGFVAFLFHFCLLPRFIFHFGLHAFAPCLFGAIMFLGFLWIFVVIHI